LDYVRDKYSKDKIGQERAEELSAAAAKLTDLIDRNQRRHVKLVAGLREKYLWRESEVGFDATEEETAPFRKPPTDSENVAARLRTLKAWKGRRPGDPFARLEWAQLVGRQRLATLPRGKAELEASAGELLAAARSCREAADLVPEGAAYSAYRLALLREGGHLGNNAAARINIAASGSRYGAACKDAAVAVDCWEECLKATTDYDGFLRMRLALALGLRGDREEARKRAEKVADLRKAAKCPLFASNVAALNGRLGKTAEAIRWLEFGVSECGLAPGDPGADPDLAAVCREYPERVRRLARPNE
ncbi:MAG TPA: hypothetical protein VFW33_20335, partial [Gemmataceae bacterium]|nr:hypothetical protein [Gemmataceae bacterium]